MLSTPHAVGQHFAYALGRLGVLENQLLKQTDIDRLLGAPSGEEAVKMLRDIEFLTVAEDASSFQDTLNASVKAVKENVEKMAPESHHFIFDILWLDGNRAEWSYTLKHQRKLTSSLSIAPEPPVIAFSPERPSEPILPNNDGILSKTDVTPKELDDFVAYHVRKRKEKLAKESGSAMIKKYVDLLHQLDDTRYKMRSGEDTDIEAIAFEKEGLAQINDLLSDMKKIILGPEALFSYATRALMQIDLLRVLLVGKTNNLEIQEIKSLLPALS